ncbi:MAG: deoxyribonuclease V [Nitrospiraceae bacterium]|nr:deoxyribonuclease V [Nitrospiraceae bacterium]
MSQEAQGPEEKGFAVKNAGEARALQRALAGRIKIVPLGKKPRFVAGADAAFLDDQVLAVACLFTYPEMELIDIKTVVMKVTFPYIPGLLGFREGPAVVRAVRGLMQKPDLLFIDGQGVAHPAKMGIASHAGLLLDIPTIGCAKSRLVGDYAEPGRKRGQRSPLFHKGELAGTVLRTKDGVRPVFISPGHRIDFEGSVEMALSCGRGFRIPEPTRVADMETKRLKKAMEEKKRQRYTEAVCKKHCSYYRPEKSARKCGAYLFLSGVLTAGEIEGVGPAERAAFDQDRVIRGLACGRCQFLTTWCPYRTAGPSKGKPCGGYLVIERLLSR